MEYSDSFRKETNICRVILLSTDESVCLTISQKEDNVSLSYVLGKSGTMPFVLFNERSSCSKWFYMLNDDNAL